MSSFQDQIQWSGVWTALVTPLKKENGDLKICVESLEKLLSSQIETGAISGFVIAGSTGEGSLLSESNYSLLLKETSRILAGRLPIIAGVGIGGTHSAFATAELAKGSGADGLLAAPPAYIKAPQRGLIDHFLKLAELGLPICLYEVASRAASSIALDTIAKLIDNDLEHSEKIVAIKDASADMKRAQECADRFGDRIAMLSGDDFTLSPFIRAGGNGVISVASHFAAKPMKRIIELAKRDEAEADKIQSSLKPFIDSLFEDSNPIPVKSLCFDEDLISQLEFYPPLLAAKEGLRKKLQELKTQIEQLS